ncbi:hypothetical protein LX36DRAFT_693887 [Colletotrichum falcatum]|nr:hypothetical protein LX36DRAFT_693887 [Colletotrichum falcatum]
MDEETGLRFSTILRSAESLRRDGFRCAYSHIIDCDSADEGLFVPPAGTTSFCITQVSHILPLALGNVDKTTEWEKEAVASIWYALYRYFPGLKNKIGPESLNQYQNLITLELGVYDLYKGHMLAFNPLYGRVSDLRSQDIPHHFDLYLTSASQPNMYAIKHLWMYRPRVQPPRGHREVMTLVSSDNHFPLAEPEFFRVHYQIAKILQLTGIRQRFHAELNAFKYDPGHLSPDGSTDVGAILHRRLLVNI